MLVYLNHAWDDLVTSGKPDKAGLHRAVIHGAALRLRPKMMTVVTIIAGLLAHHVEPGHRLRGDAAHRRPHDRRHGERPGADPAGAARRLLPVAQPAPWKAVPEQAE